MPMENEMKHPQEFTGPLSILNFSIFTLILSYVVMGLFGFVRYGESVEGSITLNLPKNEVLSLTAQSLMSIALLFSIGISFQGFCGVMWNKVGHWFPKNHNVGKMSMRFVTTVVITFLAVAIPDLGVFVALMGSFVSLTFFY